MNILESRYNDSGVEKTYILDTETVFNWLNYYSNEYYAFIESYVRSSWSRGSGTGEPLSFA